MRSKQQKTAPKVERLGPARGATQASPAECLWLLAVIRLQTGGYPFGYWRLRVWLGFGPRRQRSCQTCDPTTYGTAAGVMTSNVFGWHWIRHSCKWRCRWWTEWWALWGVWLKTPFRFRKHADLRRYAEQGIHIGLVLCIICDEPKTTYRLKKHSACEADLCKCVVQPQWVGLALPQLAPGASAFKVFIALGSVFRNSFSVSAVRVFDGWGQGHGPFLPSSLHQGSCRLLSLWVRKPSARLTPFRPCRPLLGGGGGGGGGCCCATGRRPGWREHTHTHTHTHTMRTAKTRTKQEKR